jgi:single-strand DNA-binding protein
MGGKDGSERKSEVEWFNVVCWDKLAESCNQYLSKGKLVYVEGRQKTRKWEGKDGATHYKTELVANHAVFLERSAVAPAQETEDVPPDPAPESVGTSEEELPF